MGSSFIPTCGSCPGPSESAAGCCHSFGDCNSQGGSPLPKGLTQLFLHRPMRAWEPHGRIHRASVMQHPREARLGGDKEQPCTGETDKVSGVFLCPVPPWLTICLHLQDSWLLLSTFSRALKCLKIVCVRSTSVNMGRSEDSFCESVLGQTWASRLHRKHLYPWGTSSHPHPHGTLSLPRTLHRASVLFHFIVLKSYFLLLIITSLYAYATCMGVPMEASFRVP